MNVLVILEFDYIENDELEIIKYFCVRYLVFFDFIVRYYVFKIYRDGSFFLKEDKVSIFKGISKEVVYYFSFLRDFIFFFLKKRWKSYFGNE